MQSNELPVCRLSATIHILLSVVVHVATVNPESCLTKLVVEPMKPSARHVNALREARDTGTCQHATLLSAKVWCLVTCAAVYKMPATAPQAALQTGANCDADTG